MPNFVTLAVERGAEELTALIVSLTAPLIQRYPLCNTDNDAVRHAT